MSEEKEKKDKDEKKVKLDVDLNKLLLDVRETAYLLTRSERTLYNQISQGRCPIPIKRAGRSVRFATADVIAYVDSL